jgi:hypothetical protein
MAVVELLFSESLSIMAMGIFARMILRHFGVFTSCNRDGLGCREMAQG